jgi:hypothetical protein
MALFLSVLLVVVVYLAVQFPAFRTVLIIAVVAGAGWLYHIIVENDKEDDKRRVELDKRTELSRRLIRPDEIVFTDTVLGQTYGSWNVKGNVTNRSAYELEGFRLKIIVQDCPDNRCTTIGENEVSTYLSVPPNQMRAFESYVSLHDMPEPKKWGWTYTVQELRGKVK